MRWSWLVGYGLLLGLMVACSTSPVAVRTPTPTEPPPQADTSAPPPPPQETAEPSDKPVANTPPEAPPLVADPPAKVYEASSADYRRDAARHIYRRLHDKIYKGKLPPMLKAVVVVDIHIEPTGQVGHIDWVRVPKHTPEIKHDIEQAILQSAPFPAPSSFKRVRYTDTWLWHKSGRFQLDTLTEGQH